VLPVIIRTTEESLKAVDDTFRQASLGWEPVSGKRRKIVFPIAFPISTGLISIRERGETVHIYRCCYLPKLPTSIFDQAMAYHLYDFDQRY
jgi:phosphate transport system permease protein